jgi:hypothetical protein
VPGNLIHLRQTWQPGATVTLRFETEVKIQPWRAEQIVTYGPLLFCLPLAGEFSPGREAAPGFQDSTYTLADSSTLNLHLVPQTVFTLERRPFDPARPFDSLALTGDLLNPNGTPPPARGEYFAPSNFRGRICPARRLVPACLAAKTGGDWLLAKPTAFPRAD